MIIGIDGNEANIKNRVGVNQYAWELLKSLKKLLEKNEKKHKVIVYLKNPPLSDLPSQSPFWKYKVLSGSGLWIIRRLMIELMFGREKPDVFFTPSHYLPPIINIPSVCSIMDLGYLDFSTQFKKSDFWQLKYWSAWSISISKAIIAISESTKRDIVRHYPAASKKVMVTYLGYDQQKYGQKIKVSDVRRILKKYSIVSDPKEYVLFLSTLKPSKNVTGLVDAWKRVSQEFSRLKLVIAGKKGWMFDDIFSEVKKLNLQNSIIFTDFVNEEDKASLIAGAKVFVLPSFWEGFGLDPLNAMASGIPVVVSRVGSLPEVVGDAGILVDPYNIDSIAEGVGEILESSKAEYEKFVKKGLEQARKFSWEKTARQTLGVLESVKNV